MQSRGRPATGAEFTAEVYREAARERLISAGQLYRRRDYVLCHYVAGLAVECLLRAYRYRRNPEFDGRHDLHALYEASGMTDVIPPHRIFSANAALAVVSQRWANDHRFRPEAALRRRLKRSGLDRGIRGDFLKQNARQLVQAADEFIELGLSAWRHS